MAPVGSLAQLRSLLLELICASAEALEGVSCPSGYPQLSGSVSSETLKFPKIHSIHLYNGTWDPFLSLGVDIKCLKLTAGGAMKA